MCVCVCVCVSRIPLHIKLQRTRTQMDTSKNGKTTTNYTYWVHERTSQKGYYTRGHCKPNDAGLADVPTDEIYQQDCSQHTNPEQNGLEKPF